MFMFSTASRCREPKSDTIVHSCNFDEKDENGDFFCGWKMEQENPNSE